MISRARTLLLGVLAVLVTACAPAPETPLAPPPPPSAGPVAPQAAVAGDILPRSEPDSVQIPSIGSASSLIPLGLNEDRTVEVPSVYNPMQAGWYRFGPTPGEQGAAVVLGHVDGVDRAGVFYRLRELRPGGEIDIHRRDGRTVRFEVERVEQVDKDHFPSQSVYGETDRAELRLVTCGGTFDRAAGSYRDSIIVYAVLAAVI